MRRSKLHGPENHDRWLVSYADFVTLLFAFFVVLFASTKTDRGHVKAVSQSFEKALRNGGVSPQLATLLNGGLPPEPPTVDRPQENNLSRSLELLKSSLKSELEKGTVRLSLQKRGLVIELEAGAFFASGEDNVNTSAYPTVSRLAAILNGLPNALRLEGHTDSLPISNSHFRSNWELSAARSIAMLRLLDERFKVNPKRMAIVGYADTAAIDSDETEEGRIRNRRVDIVILNEQGMTAEPASMASDLHSNQTVAGPSATQPEIIR